VLLNLLRKCFYLVFGVLAFFFSAMIFAWICYNLFSEIPDQEFLRSLSENLWWQIVSVVSGLLSSISMAVVGAYWVWKGWGIRLRKNSEID
jgi:hypothetical protein